MFRKMTHPAFLTAPVQLKEAAAVPVCLARYGELCTLSASSSSLTAVVSDIRSSSDICNRPQTTFSNPHSVGPTYPEG